jgi:hypothetical protein
MNSLIAGANVTYSMSSTRITASSSGHVSVYGLAAVGGADEPEP